MFLKTKHVLPQVKISPNGRKFLRQGLPTGATASAANATIYNVENMVNVSGDVHGGISQSDNRVTITQQLERLQSEIKKQNILEETKRELLLKIDELKTEHAKNTDTSREKITKIISDVVRISAELGPVLSKIFGI